MGQCLVDARVGAAVDEACAALYRLGEPGTAEMKARLTATYQAVKVGAHQLGAVAGWDISCKGDGLLCFVNGETGSDYLLAVVVVGVPESQGE